MANTDRRPKTGREPFTLPYRSPGPGRVSHTRAGPLRLRNRRSGKSIQKKSLRLRRPIPARSHAPGAGPVAKTLRLRGRRSWRGDFSGRNAQPVDSFNTPQAQELLPGNLLRQARRPEGDLYLAPAICSTHLRSITGAKRIDTMEPFPGISLLGTRQVASGRGRGAALFRRPPGRAERPIGADSH